jgi:hypothetical protein
MAVMLYSAAWVASLLRNQMSTLADYAPLGAISAAELFQVMFPTERGRQAIRTVLIGSAASGCLMGIGVGAYGLVALWALGMLIGSHLVGLSLGHRLRFLHHMGLSDIEIVGLVPAVSPPWQTRLHENHRTLSVFARVGLYAELVIFVLFGALASFAMRSIWPIVVVLSIWLVGATIILLPDRRSIFAELSGLGWIAVHLPLLFVAVACVMRVVGF